MPLVLVFHQIDLLSKMYISEAYNMVAVEPGENQSQLMGSMCYFRREESQP
jgi:hypothetical protein